MRQFLTISFICLMCSARAWAVGITIPAQVRVSGSQVVLGDIATIDGTPEETAALRRITLDTAPPIGKSRALSLGMIRVQLKRCGVDPDQLTLACPETVTVTRAATAISGDTVIAIAQDWLATQLPNTGEDEFVVTPLRIQQQTLSIPEGAVSWNCQPVGAATSPTRHVMVGLQVDGKTAWQGMVSFSVQHFAQVLVAKSMIPRGATVTPSQLTTERRDVTRITGMPLCDSETITGMCASITIAAGSIITQSMLDTIPMVKQNDQVRVVAQAGGLRIVNLAVACEDGGKDAVIRVRNMQTRETFMARVVAPGELSLLY